MIDQILLKLSQMTGVKPIRSGHNRWKAICPCHPDKNPSLSITLRNDGGLLYHCFAGCDWKDVRQAIDNGVSVSYNIDYKPPEREKRVLIATYVYRDEYNNPLYRKLRFIPKNFSLQVYKNGKWVSEKGGVNRSLAVLYNLPEIISASTVFIVEGEKAANKLTEWGLVGTCSFDGASIYKKNATANPKWQVRYNKYLENKHIVLLPDNDPPGISHMSYIYSTLQNVRSKKIIQLPGLAYGDDFYDWALLNDISMLRELWKSS